MLPLSNVMNPWHFGKDPGGSVPLLRIRLLLFLSVADKMPTKICFFSKFICSLLFEGTFTSVFIDKKSKRSHKLEEIKVFLIFLAC
jgi:hypothetical protein